MTVPWYIAALGASACIQYVELQNARATGDWIETLPVTIVPIVLAQWGLFLTWKGAPNLMTAWVVFTLANCVMRLGSSWLFAGQTFDWRTPLGVLIMIAGGQIVKAGLR